MAGAANTAFQCSIFFSLLISRKCDKICQKLLQFLYASATFAFIKSDRCCLCNHIMYYSGTPNRSFMYISFSSSMHCPFSGYFLREIYFLIHWCFYNVIFYPTIFAYLADKSGQFAVAIDRLLPFAAFYLYNR